jgi:hypothetical protein
LSWGQPERLALVEGPAPPGSPPIEGLLFKRALPVDVRHKAKIRRGELKRWAERRLRRRG